MSIHFLEGCSEIPMYFSSLFTFTSCILVLWPFHIHCTLWLYIYDDDVCFLFTNLSMCCFFSIFIHMFLKYAILISVSHKMPWWVLFKVFQKDRLLNSTMPWTLFLQSFSIVCVRVRFCCITSTYELSDLRLLSWLVVLLWVCHGLPKEEIDKDIFM